MLEAPCVNVVLFVAVHAEHKRPPLRLPCACHLPGGDVEAEDVGVVVIDEDQGCKCWLVVMPGGLVEDLVRYRVARSLSRVTA
jgi:hypothetical protein